MYVHSNKISDYGIFSRFQNFLVQNAVAQKLLSILILPQLKIKDCNFVLGNQNHGFGS